MPTLHRIVDAAGKKRIIMFSGLYPIRMAVTEDDGANWSDLKPIGDFGGVVTMSTVIDLKTGPGHYMAFFHDDGRFIRGGSEAKYLVKTPFTDHTSPAAKPWRFWVYTSITKDGGLTWSVPAPIAMLPDASLCEPGALRSPDGKQIAVLLRENSRKYNSFVIFSNDEGLTWTEPKELPAALTGDRHVAKYAPDGRLFISFRDTTHVSPTKGDWVGWVGTYDDIVKGKRGAVSRAHHGQHEGRRLHLSRRRAAARRHHSSPRPTATGPKANRPTSSACASSSKSWTRR